jgi:hypothetical protein
MAISRQILCGVYPLGLGTYYAADPVSGTPLSNFMVKKR